jgi:hypothetical protein
LVRHQTTRSSPGTGRGLRLAKQIGGEGLLPTCFMRAGPSASQRVADEAASPVAVVLVGRKRDRGETNSAHHRGRTRPGWGMVVRNPQGVEGALRSCFQARTDRYPGPPDEGRRRRKAKNPPSKAEEGRAKARRSSWHTSEGKRSGEHRPGTGVTPETRNGLLAG